MKPLLSLLLGLCFLSASSQDTTTHVAGTITGTMQYDIPSGTAVNGDLDTNMNMDVNAGGQSVPITVGIKTKITGKKS